MSSTGQSFPTTDAYKLVRLGIPPDHAVQIAAQNQARLLGKGGVDMTSWQPSGTAPDPTQIPPPNLASSAWVPALPQYIAHDPRVCLPNVRQFVRDHYDQANTIASQLPSGTTGQDVLTTSAVETKYGDPSKSATKAGDWYGVHELAPLDGAIPQYYPGQNGVYVTKYGDLMPRFSGGLDGAAGTAFVNRAAPLLRNSAQVPPTSLDYLSALHRVGRGPWGVGSSADAKNYVPNAASAFDRIADCLD